SRSQPAASTHTQASDARAPGPVSPPKLTKTESNVPVRGRPRAMSVSPGTRARGPGRPAGPGDGPRLTPDSGGEVTRGTAGGGAAGAQAWRTWWPGLARAGTAVARVEGAGRRPASRTETYT